MCVCVCATLFNSLYILIILRGRSFFLEIFISKFYIYRDYILFLYCIRISRYKRDDRQ